MIRPIDELRALIEGETAAQPLMRSIRGYNQAMVGELAKVRPLEGLAVLDLGASIHGYALEAALDQGASLYEGIDFDVERHWHAPEVAFGAPDGRIGRLQHMNAEQLTFGDASFDCALTISTFEHFHHPRQVLQEMHRVLRPGGHALLSFEPVWTASYGHHLHHFGAISDLVPPWSHLFLSEDQMRDVLSRQQWPPDAPVSIEEALQWIYRGPGINRFPLSELKTCFEQSPFEVAWMYPLLDEGVEQGAAIAKYVGSVTAHSKEDLLTRGLSALLLKR